MIGVTWVLCTNGGRFAGSCVWGWKRGVGGEYIYLGGSRHGVETDEGGLFKWFFWWVLLGDFFFFFWLYFFLDTTDLGLGIGDFFKSYGFPFKCILGWVDLGSHLLFLISHYYFTSLYFTLIYLFGVVYVTQKFHWDALYFATLYGTWHLFIYIGWPYRCTCLSSYVIWACMVYSCFLSFANLKLWCVKWLLRFKDQVMSYENGLESFYFLQNFHYLF